MKIEQLIGKISEYSQTVLVCNAKSWAARFALGAGTEAMLGRADQFIRATGTVSGDGEVDIAALHRIVASGFKSAGHVDLFGGLIGFDPQDAEDLFSYIGT